MEKITEISNRNFPKEVVTIKEHDPTLENFCEIKPEHISREEFELYQSLKKSGICNMCHVSKVAMITGLSKAKATTIFVNYRMLAEKFGGE